MNQVTKDVRNLSYTYLDPASYLKLISENPGEFDPKVCKKILENEGKNNEDLNQKIANVIVHPMIDYIAPEEKEEIARGFPKMTTEELKKFAMLYDKPSNNYLEKIGKMVVDNADVFDNLVIEGSSEYGEYLIENHFNLLEDVDNILIALREQVEDMIESDGEEILVKCSISVRNLKLTKLITLLEDKIKVVNF